MEDKALITEAYQLLSELNKSYQALSRNLKKRKSLTTVS